MINIYVTVSAAPSATSNFGYFTPVHFIIWEDSTLLHVNFLTHEKLILYLQNAYICLFHMKIKFIYKLLYNNED